MKDIHDVITHAKFGDDRLRGSGVVAGQISSFPIDFAGRLYNTHTAVWACDKQQKNNTTTINVFPEKGFYKSDRHSWESTWAILRWRGTIDFDDNQRTSGPGVCTFPMYQL